MKFLQFLLMFCFLSFSLASCSSDKPTPEVNTSEISSDTRGVQMVEFQGNAVVLDQSVKVTMQRESANADEDAVSSIMRSLMGAENEAQELDVNFTMSDEPVEDGLFVFGIESDDSKELTFTMYDEEGFELSANNTIDVHAGNNYKGLNVKSLENGTYYFKLSDSGGKELTRTVTVQHY